jgi:hypothetical protein
MIKVGDTLPSTTLMEYSEVEGEGCSIGPNPVDVSKAAAGKTIALFGLNMYRVTLDTLKRLRQQVWMKSGALALMTPSLWARGHGTKRRVLKSACSVMAMQALPRLRV